MTSYKQMTSYKKLFGRFISKKCLWLGEKNYLLCKGGVIKEVGKDYSGNVRLIILEKSCYFETIHTFPFSNIKDIRSAIEIDISRYSPLKGERFFVKKIENRSKSEGEEGEGLTVNIWFMDKKIAKRLSILPHLFVIPESALLSFQDGSADRIYKIFRDDDNYLFAFVKHNGGVQSRVSLNGGEDDFQEFIRSIGSTAHDCSVINIEGRDAFFLRCMDMIHNIKINNALSFLDMGSISPAVYKKYIKMGIINIAVLILLYLGVSGVLPYLALNRIDKENKVLSGDLAGLLKKQELIDNYYSRYKVLAKKINSYPCKILLLNMLSHYLPLNTRIRQLTVSGHVVEITGRTKKTSALLGDLSRAKRIKGARLTAPLRKDTKSGMELFRIMFTYE